MANNITWMRHRRALEGQPHKETNTGALLSFPSVPSIIPALTANITPVQDLHGGYPCTAGNGKNKFQTTATTGTINNVKFTVETDGSVTITGVPSAAVSTYIFGEVTLPAGTYKANGFASGASNSTRLVYLNKGTSAVLASIYSGRDIEFTLASETTVKVYPIVPSTFSGSALTFYPMIRVSTETDATFTPYENICPISGWAGSKVTVTSTNLIGGTLLRDSIKSALPSATINETAKTIEFAANAAVSSAIIGQGLTTSVGLKFKFKENTSYTFIISGYNTNSGSKRVNLRVNYTDGTYSYIPDFPTTAATKQVTVYRTNSTKTVLSLTKSNLNSSTVIYYDESGIFEGAIETDDFVPFGQYFNYTFTDAGTVYGGSLNVKTGVLTVDKVHESLTSKTWQTRVTGEKKKLFSSSVEQYYTTGTTSGYKPDFIMDRYVIQGSTSAAAVTVNDIDDRSIGIYGLRTTATHSTTIYAILNIGDTPEGEIVYKIETPTTYQLTPQQVKALVKKSSIWADTGDVTATYWTF